MSIKNRRKETRYPVPKIYRQYILLRIKDMADNFINAALIDFSRHGIRLKSPIYMNPDKIFECSISIPASLTKEVKFRIKVRFCAEDTAEEFIVGSEIVEIPDKLWFRVFEKVHNFIRERAGTVF